MDARIDQALGDHTTCGLDRRQDFAQHDDFNRKPSIFKARLFSQNRYTPIRNPQIEGKFPEI